MSQLRKTLVALAAASFLTLATSAAQAEDYADSISSAPSGGAMAFDLVVVRPLGVVATVVGTVLFVAALPIALFTWDVKSPAERLVVEPARFTFARDLGDMD
jgi:hypothetical protein